MSHTLIAPARAALERAHRALLDVLHTHYGHHLITPDIATITQEILTATTDPQVLGMLDVTITDILGEYDELPKPPSYILAEIRQFQRAIARLAIMENHVHRASLALA